ncbi:nuclear receptor-interacting protein 3 isoform X1 [Bufo gargarizans]|uniref:nuclear receptor-interacting protein 3 isoform X1 n=1 Tax=Bufo gargarizans TaxID=30331 RepID=UPI001CF3A07B|nr:nuclear receptor-interacting protein 3 isoform X1 [Bufo gargarizans]
MFYSGILTDSSRKDGDLREAASLRQQRRTKQSLQFIHKDSADLLPLDGLKRLGTSKDTNPPQMGRGYWKLNSALLEEAEQPHNILQRRLLESNLSKLRSNRPTWIPKCEAQSNKLHQGKGERPRKSDEDNAVFVWCQCAGKEMKVKIDTSCQHSVISSACLDRLGLKEHFRSYKEENLSLPYNMKSIGQVELLTVTLGRISLDCAAAVIDDKEQSFSLGLQALRSLKCVINLEKNHLEVGRTEREVVPFIASRHASREENSSDVS